MLLRMTSREVSHSRKGACGATRSAPAPQAGTHGVSKRRQGTPGGRLHLNACHWSTHAACCSEQWVYIRTDQRQAHARSMAPPLAEVAWPGARHANTHTRAHVHACTTSGDARLGRSIRTILSVSPARAAPPAARAREPPSACSRVHVGAGASARTSCTVTSRSTGSALDAHTASGTYLVRQEPSTGSLGRREYSADCTLRPEARLAPTPGFTFRPPPTVRPQTLPQDRLTISSKS